MARPTVTVVIPTRDRLALLRQALDSVAAQTYRDFEVVVVDDGSQEDIAAGVADHPCGPRVIRSPHSAGPAAARNYGITQAQGSIIAFLDSDDLWGPDKLTRFVEALTARSGFRIFYGPMTPITAEGRPVPGRTKPCIEGRITQALFRSSFVHVPTVVCDRELLQRYGGFDESLPVCEDYDLWLRISADEPFGLIEEPLALRRLHSDRLSKSWMSRNLVVKARMLRRFYESIAARNLVDPKIATARLGRVCYIAGRAALFDRRFREADAMLAASRQYGAESFRSVPLGWVARAMSRLVREPSPLPIDGAPGVPIEAKH